MDTAPSQPKPTETEPVDAISAVNPPPPPEAVPIKTVASTPPPAMSTVLEGKETEEIAELRRKLEARDKDLVSRESRLAQREAALQRAAETRRAPEKHAWLAGNALFD